MKATHVIHMGDGRKIDAQEIASFHTSGVIVRVFATSDVVGYGGIAEDLVSDDIPFGVAYASPNEHNPRFIAIKERKPL